MVSGKKAKLLVFELLQFAGLVTPVFVAMQRFAGVVRQAQGGTQPSRDPSVAYWLIVASSIAYVATTTLLVWLPVKYLVFRRSGFFRERRSWRPVSLVFVTLSTLPCFAFIVASSQVQIHQSGEYDSFGELPVSLVLLSLICVDVIERIRPRRLTGQDEIATSAAFPGPALVLTESVSTVTGQLDDHGDERWTRANGSADFHRYSGPVLTSLVAHEPDLDGPLRWLRVHDPRSKLFVSGFLFWLDTVEMLRVASLPSIYLSNWLFPIYVVSYLSSLRVIAAPQSPCGPSLGVWLQDFPFLILRIALIAAFGLVTPVLYLVKNLLVTLSFVYFNYMIKLRIFNTERLL
ncbi:transmembrane protein 236-like [Scleropages formosus]|uniref:transmembrane protein 236-like n=1 Tax=Scleropages formosus TaxID=113540 RepID=UPI0010FA6DD0|nr:transmembrane protein 236-like [Scleropages formosus]